LLTQRAEHGLRQSGQARPAIPETSLLCAITTCNSFDHTATVESALTLEHHTHTLRNTSPLQNLPPTNTAKMSDDEDRVTMPFKFVTGKFSHPRASRPRLFKHETQPAAAR
jgi:hypothetical protein